MSNGVVRMKIETLIKQTRLLISLDLPVEEIRSSLLKHGCDDGMIHLIYTAAVLLGNNNGS